MCGTHFALHAHAGRAPWELPECLLGCFRVHRLNTTSGASRLDYSRELPLLLPAAATVAGPATANAAAAAGGVAGGSTTRLHSP